MPSGGSPVIAEATAPLKQPLGEALLKKFQGKCTELPDCLPAGPGSAQAAPAAPVTAAPVTAAPATEAPPTDEPEAEETP